MKIERPRLFTLIVFVCIVIIFVLFVVTIPHAPKPSLRGINVWVVDTRDVGHLERFIKKVRGHGVHILCVKGHYGARMGHSDGPGKPEVVDQANQKLVKLCHKYGIWCFAWGFNLGREPEAEKKTIIKLLHRRIDGYIFNVEGALKNRQNQLHVLVKGVWGHVNKCSQCRSKVIAYDPIAHIRYEKRIDWDVLHKLTQATMPQVYWRNKYAKWRWKIGGWPNVPKPIAWLNYVEYNVNDLQDRVARKPFIPLGHAYRETVPAPEVEQFIAECVKRKYPGVGLYCADKFSDEHWRVIGKHSHYFNHVPRPLPDG